MRKLFLLILCLTVSLFAGACNQNNNTDSNIETDNSMNKPEISYESLYFKNQTTWYPEISGLNVYKSSYGYLNKLEQGYNCFYYLYKTTNSDVKEMQLTENGWNYEDSYLENDVMHSTVNVSAVRGFIAPCSGEALIYGNYFDVSSNGNSVITILQNGEVIYSTTESMVLKPADTEGYYLEVKCNLKENDLICFVLEAVEDDATVSFNPTVDYVMSKESSLHYILPEGYPNDTYLGDVHPFYDNGKMYMYYLNTSGRFQSCLITSDNLINYSRSICESHSSNPPEQDNYFVLGVCKYKDGKYRSYFGLGDGYGCAVSDDLHIWSNADVLDEKFKVMYRTYFDYDNYPAGGRDPYIFYDENIDRYCVIAMGYKTKEDRYLILYVSEDSEGKYYTEKPIALMNFKNGDPECPMAMKIGNRWYIFTSIYGNSSHGVGRLSYWIGDENKDITEVDWMNKTEHYLEGEDLEAAQLVEVGDKYYLYGWIPSQAIGGCWGGYLNIAREVIQLEDGTLGTRLDPVLNQIISKGKLFDINEGNFSNIQGFNVVANTLTSTTSASADLNVNIKRNVIDCNIDLSSSVNNEASFVFSQGTLKVKVSILYDGKDAYVSVSKVDGVRRTEYSKMKINGTVDLKNISLRIIAEGNIMEVFVNENTGLCANTSLDLNKYSNVTIESLAGVTISNLTISKLSNADNILD